MIQPEKLRHLVQEGHETSSGGLVIGAVGEGRVGEDGCFSIYVEKPLAYKVKGVLYRPHIHYAFGNKRGTSWEKKQYTIEV